MKFDDDILIQFALDLLDTDTRMTVENELAISSALREQLVEIKATLENIPLAEHPIIPNKQLRQLVLGSIETESRLAGFAKRFAEFFDLDSESASKLLEKVVAVNDQPWKTTLLPGTRILKFTGGPRIAGATCGIVSMPPNQAFPAHQHRADEWTLILQGTAHDEKGHRLQPGDLLHSRPGTIHTLQSGSGEPLVFAVILNKPNKWLLWRTVLWAVAVSHRQPYKSTSQSDRAFKISF